MKKIIFIFLVILSFSKSNGQIGLQANAIWHYDWGGLMGGGFIKMQYTGDTIILGKNCNVLHSDIYHFVYDQFQILHFLGVNPYRNDYISVSGDTVFRYLNNQFFVLYNFGAQPGDTWDLGVDTNTLLCGHSYARVDSIGTMTINNTSYRWIYLNMVPNSSVGLFGRVVERFGAIEGYFFPVDNNCDPNIIVEYDYYSFSCFEDDSFPLYNRNTVGCEDLLLHVGIEDPIVNQMEYTIFPNPTNDLINIKCQGKNNFDVEIYSISGLYIKSIAAESGIIKTGISDLSQGIYILRITDGNGANCIRKFTKL